MRFMSIFVLIIIIAFSINTVNGIDIGYPTIVKAGFHHNALLYVDAIYSPEALKSWLTGSYGSPGSGPVIFDTITILAQSTPSNAQTAYSTNQQDWIWFSGANFSVHMVFYLI